MSGENGEETGASSLAASSIAASSLFPYTPAIAAARSNGGASAASVNREFIPGDAGAKENRFSRIARFARGGTDSGEDERNQRIVIARD